jgi:hypothetical protein
MYAINNENLQQFRHRISLVQTLPTKMKHCSYLFYSAVTATSHKSAPNGSARPAAAFNFRASQSANGDGCSDTLGSKAAWGGRSVGLNVVQSVYACGFRSNIHVCCWT